MGRLQSIDHNFLQHIGAAGLTILLVGAGEPSYSQVVSAGDSISTQVVRQGQQFTISGGMPADSASLLFHSFEQFNLESAHTAEFIVNSNVETIVSRVINGLPSQIDGLIAVSGAPASLYLMNPAGLLFGAGAELNLGGDFTAVTAERLDFTSGSFGLVGDPDDVQGHVLKIHFDPHVPSPIINSGSLRVGSSNALSLIGHTVSNRGTLSGGEITLVAVGHHPQVSLVNGLSYPLPANIETVAPWLLPNQVEHATAIEVDSNGMLQLTGAQSLATLSPGTAWVGGSLTASGSESKIQVLGDFVATAGATVGADNGGTILIGGDYQGQGHLPTAQTTVVDAASTLQADGLSDQQTGGQVVVWADDSTRFLGDISAQGNQSGGNVEISGKQHLYFDGQVDLQSPGTPGTLLLDPQNIEIRAGADPGGDTNPEVLYENTLETSIAGAPNLVIQADDDITINPLSDGVLNFPGSIRFLADANNDGQGSFVMDPNDQLRTVGQTIEITAADITVGDLNTSAFSTIDNDLDGGEIKLVATHGDIVAGNLNSSARGTLNNNGNGGQVVLSAFDTITVQDIQTTTENEILNNNGRAGDILLIAETGNINAGMLSTKISSSSNTGIGGDISLLAAGNIFADSIVSSINVNASNLASAGNVSLTSLTANIETGSIAADTSAGTNNSGNGGNIAINAPQGTIRSQQLISTANSPDLEDTQGGDVQLASLGDIVVDFIDASAQGSGGNIDIATQNFFQAIDRIPNTDISLLTTGESNIRIAYRSDSTTPFVVGDSRVHGTLGSLVTDVDQLIGPQSITQSVNLDTIQLINTFQVPPPDSPAVIAEPPNIATPTVLTEDPRSDANDLLRENNNVLELGDNGASTGRGEEQDNVLDANSEESILVQIDNTFSAEFARALDLPIPAPPTLKTLQDTLQEVERTQSITPGIMYVRLKNNNLELLLVSGQGPPVYHPVDITAVEMQSVIDDLHRTVMNPLLRPAQYLPPAQQLYDWLVRPMVDELEMANIDHIGFVLDAGLRSLPMAALHDGEEFLIEQYSIGLLPSAGLTDLSPQRQVLSQSDTTVEPDSVLAMGIADFTHQADLEAVPLELELAVQSTGDNYYLDHETTLAELEHQLENNRFTSMHLATHAVFEAGNLENSYVQLWDRAISLAELQELPLDAIDFLILSACATALGDANAEFGFAGLAVKVGVRTALASLWSISDEGTLGLMAEFYQALETTPTRSAALRQAQIAMLRGDVGVHQGQVYGQGNRDIGYLSGLDASGSWDFSHPAYWSGFTMIGNPW